MKRILLLTLSIIFIGCSSNYKSDSSLQKGTACMDNMDYKEALKMFDLFIQENPKNVEAYSRKAGSLMYLGKISEAFSVLEKARLIDSLSIDLLNAYGAYFIAIGDFAKSRESFFKAYKIDSTNKVTCSNLGILFSISNDPKSSIYFHTKAIKYDPLNAGYYANRGAAYEYNGNYDLALEDLNNAKKYSKTKKELMYSCFVKGLVLRDLGNLSKSIEEFSTSIEIYPSYDLSYYYRGLSYAGIHEYKKAIDDFQIAKKSGNVDVDKMILECENMLK